MKQDAANPETRGARPDADRADRHGCDPGDSCFGGGAGGALQGEARSGARTAPRFVGDARRDRSLQGCGGPRRIPDQGGQPELSAGPGHAGERRGCAGQEGEVSAPHSGGSDDRQDRVGHALDAGRSDVGLRLAGRAFSMCIRSRRARPWTAPSTRTGRNSDMRRNADDRTRALR